MLLLPRSGAFLYAAASPALACVNPLCVDNAVATPMEGNANLAGFRILDCTEESGYLAGKLLAELGAEVIKVEPPSGDPGRYRPPFIGANPNPELSVPWLALNTSKRSVTLDLASAADRELFLALVATADAVLETAGANATLGPLAHGIDEAMLRAANPNIAICRLSPFGLHGPYASRRGSDLTVLALGGNLYPTGNPDRAPVRCALPVSHFHGGLELAVATVFALWSRSVHGVAQTVDVSLQECLTIPNMTTPTQYPFTGFKGRRVGGGFRGAKAFFRELWPCKDGWISFALRGGPARNPGIQALVDYMRECGVADPALDRDWLQYNHNTVSQEEVDAIEAALGAFFRTKTMEELFRVACERNLLLAPALSAREIVRSRQLAAREFFVDLEDRGRGLILRYPAAFARTSLGPARVRAPAPRLGEHNQLILEPLRKGKLRGKAEEQA
ncbi:MAG: CoA transferase [Candidatus Binatia bacterium]|nr:MAG: CoA transferase [Candidatus Binatia bacterium]